MVNFSLLPVRLCFHPCMTFLFVCCLVDLSAGLQKKLLDGFPSRLDAEWVSGQNRPNKLLANGDKAWMQEFFLTVFLSTFFSQGIMRRS